MNTQFAIGSAYVATPSIEGAKKRIVVPIGRDGKCIQFAFLDALANGVCDARFMDDFGREVVQLKADEGVYTVSAACSLEAKDAVIVYDILRHHKQMQAEGVGR